ncbi:hypothetical protein [Emticicia sp. BO119]|uniref:hypothetical protein n=1 Tax=Emticicia sp. BO119 TaxID=2757768 RepID=UPI0015F02773|nr:hypothetical protein [Emticicia sp. BO119]MBA4854128.1 hypothetical protein [Emticicia sp. BO119]MBA4854129.1 hypothetical protein [Emticicia sp. BO119]
MVPPLQPVAVKVAVSFRHTTISATCTLTGGFTVTLPASLALQALPLALTVHVAVKL